MRKPKGMKRTSESYNINTRTYWNGVYGDEQQRKEYEASGTSKIIYNYGQFQAVDKTRRFERAVDEIKDGDKVLDIGCGVGNFTKLVKEKHPKCEIWGTDISDSIIKLDKLENPDIKYLAQTIGYQNQVPLRYFDIVFCGETIEHLDEPDILFQDAYKMLKTGGKLIITTPNKDHIKSEEHVWFFEKEDVERLFEYNGFKDVEFVKLPDLEHVFVMFGIGVKV